MFFAPISPKPDTDNEMMFWFSSDRPRVTINKFMTYLMEPCDRTELNDLMINWNKHCFAWTSGQTFTVSCRCCAVVIVVVVVVVVVDNICY